MGGGGLQVGGRGREQVAPEEALPLPACDLKQLGVFTESSLYHWQKETLLEQQLCAEWCWVLGDTTMN